MKRFKFKNGYLKTPVFFPDATRAVVRALDSEDIKKTGTLGILVNTYHLYTDLGDKVLKKFGGVREFMNFKGAVISDSGGFQVMSLCKTKGGKVTDVGVKFNLSKNKSMLLTPEKSIDYQMLLKPDMLVVLDDFTMPNASKEEARETVERTILWAKRCKVEFERICKKKKIAKKDRPYLLAVVQGGKYQDLREECALRLLKIGFDGYGYGGWPMDENNKFDLASAKTISKIVPKDKFLYGLGIGKPEDIIACAKLGFNIFDCVLPTRDARHGRLYVYKAKSIDKIDINKKNFYKYLTPKRGKYSNDDSPISTACDCLLCRKYSKGYLYHLFKMKDLTAYRLATIHNLRFYSILMEKLRLQSATAGINPAV